MTRQGGGGLPEKAEEASQCLREASSVKKGSSVMGYSFTIRIV